MEEDPWWQEVRAGFKQQKAEIVIDHSASFGEKDFRTLLLKIQLAAPDALLMGFSNEASFLSFARQAQGLLKL